MERLLKNIYILIIFIFSSLIIVSCDDDDKFSTNSSDRLTFEEDTIRFDTLITTISSSTKRFKVFNNNDRGLRLTSVRLASGGNSGFRINVDGHSGDNLTDIEILRKDSIVVFA